MTGSALLRAWRNRLNLTQADAAERLGIAQGVLSRYEKGISLPRLDFASRIADRTAGAVPISSWTKPDRKRARKARAA